MAKLCRSVCGGDPGGGVVNGNAAEIGRRLAEAGFKVVVVDNLYSGNRWAVPEQIPFVECDAGNSEAVADTIRIGYADLD